MARSCRCGPGLPEKATHDDKRNGTTTLFAALAPLAALARLQPWDEEDEAEGPIVDLSESQACLAF